MTYQVRLTTRAFRQLRGLDGQARRRVQAIVELLAVTPRPAGTKLLAGGQGTRRVRTGDYRVLYQINDQVLVVLVIAIGHRREVYARAVR